MRCGCGGSQALCTAHQSLSVASMRLWSQTSKVFYLSHSRRGVCTYHSGLAARRPEIHFLIESRSHFFFAWLEFVRVAFLFNVRCLAVYCIQWSHDMAASVATFFLPNFFLSGNIFFCRKLFVYNAKFGAKNQTFSPYFLCPKCADVCQKMATLCLSAF